MPVKIRKRITALTMYEKVKPRFFRMVNHFIKDKIQSFLDKGLSPVNQRDAKVKNTGGKNRFVGYSDSYKKQILEGAEGSQKRIRPINLKHTRKLHKSIKSRVTRNSVRVWFTDKKAKYHNNLGAGKSKVIRRILPTEGESWARTIQTTINKTLERAFKL
jgi:hypothetical protein